MNRCHAANEKYLTEALAFFVFIYQWKKNCISQQFKLTTQCLKNTELLYYHRNIPKEESYLNTDR
jgi:hypothetical protein